MTKENKINYECGFVYPDVTSLGETFAKDIKYGQGVVHEYEPGSVRVNLENNCLVQICHLSVPMENIGSIRSKGDISSEVMNVIGDLDGSLIDRLTQYQFKDELCFTQKGIYLSPIMGNDMRLGDAVKGIPRPELDLRDHYLGEDVSFIGESVGFIGEEPIDEFELKPVETFGRLRKLVGEKCNYFLEEGRFLAQGETVAKRVHNTLDIYDAVSEHNEWMKEDVARQKANGAKGRVCASLVHIIHK